MNENHKKQYLFFSYLGFFSWHDLGLEEAVISYNSSIVRGSFIGVRAGGGGGLQPPQILANSDFFGRREKIWAKPVSVFFKSLFWRDKYFLF